LGIVIIGTGLAGYNTAREFRKNDGDTPLTLVTVDSGRSYYKPRLSNGYRKGDSPADLVQAEPDEMADDLGARVITEQSVAGIDRETKQVQLAGGEALAYDQLVLAMGADPIRPPLAGDGVDAVWQVNDLDDYEAFRRHGDKASSVLIMGGGLIGCEFANDLAEAGHHVDMVFPEATPLPKLLPATPAHSLHGALEGLGVGLHTGLTVDRVDRDGHGVAATLSDGRVMRADLALAAIGLSPRTALAAQVGLATERGIRVDEQLTTSDPSIYALGDCAEVCGYVLPYVMPLNNAAKALGKTLAGEPTPVDYPVMPVSVKTSCCQVVAWPPEPDTPGEWQFHGEAPDWRAEFRDGQGSLRGFALTGKRIKERMQLSKEMPALIGGED
jgi:rubredoxin-NAD+ reductase